MFSKLLLLAPVALFLCHCSGGYGSMPLAKAPKIVNVSSWDPKERQRSGSGFSENDVSSLAANGASGLIARAGKGGSADSKCGAFLSAAKRSGLRLGTYYFVTKGSSPERQAEQYVSLVSSHARQRGLLGEPILLVGDFDTRSTAEEMLRFLNRVEQLTGVKPVIYLENSSRMRTAMMSASSGEKQRLKRHPYWIALYSADNGFQTPKDLMKAHGVWNRWSMWQYGGVEWSRGRSQPLVYHHGGWRAPRYFGTMDRPLEHNAFNGSENELAEFWARHSWRVP